MSLQEEIIKQLREAPKSLEELQMATSKGDRNIVARISDLRRAGYSIELKPVETKKYVLIDNNTSNKVIDYIKENNLFNANIDINKFAKELDVSIETIKSAVAKLFNKYNILQVDNNTIRFIKT